MAFRPFLPPATLVYMTHSAVVSRSETALPLRTREKGGGRERPPQKQGGHAVPHRWHLGHASVPDPDAIDGTQKRARNFRPRSVFALAAAWAWVGAYQIPEAST